MRKPPPDWGRGPDWARRLERRARPSTSSKDKSEIRAWFLGNLTDGWFTGAPEFAIDDYEILVVGEIPAEGIAELADEERSIAEKARIARFRDDSRARRMEIAARAEQQFARKVSWGAASGGTRELFTTASFPVMSRLHLAQRQTLDTLVEAGVARSRSDALAWCVDLVAANEDEWIARLREALRSVEQARGEGPASRV